MIKQKHYTNDGDHPEDRIYRDKQYINRLQRHIDEVYENLAKDLRLNEEGKDLLFDYVYNEDKEIEFEDFLEGLGMRYDEVFINRLPSLTTHAVPKKWVEY